MEIHVASKSMLKVTDTDTADTAGTSVESTPASQIPKVATVGFKRSVAA